MKIEDITKAYNNIGTSKNMDEEMKGEDFYINERRKKKVLNMIKS